MPNISKNKLRARRAVSCKRKPDSDIEIDDDSFHPRYKNTNEIFFDLKEFQELLVKLCEVLIFICNNKRIVSIFIYLLLRLIYF